MTAVDLPATTVHARLEWAKTQIGLQHLNAVIQVLVDAGWCVEDAREAALYGLAASYLVAVENEETA